MKFRGGWALLWLSVACFVVVAGISTTGLNQESKDIEAEVRKALTEAPRVLVVIDVDNKYLEARLEDSRKKQQLR